MGDGGTVATAVIIKIKQGAFQEFSRQLVTDFKLTGLSIPKFQMLATILPNDVIDDLKQNNAIETIYLDRELRIPELKGSSISFDPIRRAMLAAAELRARKAVLVMKTKWVPTGESRKVLEADQAAMDGIEGQGVKIAIVDTDSSARYQSHVQLRGRVSGHPIVEEASDKNGHGGHVTTTALGAEFVPRMLGGKAWGMAPKATGIGVKVLRGPMGMGNTSDVIKGIEYAVDWGAHVINLSLGGEPTDKPEDDAMFPVFQEVKNKTIVVAAIGNEGPESSTTSAPGCLPNVLSVGAVDSNGEIASFSSRGPTPDYRIKPDVVAPGVNIWSGITIDTFLDYTGDHLGNGFTAISGTSMATPHVSGLLALATQLFQRDLPGTPLTLELVLKICDALGRKKDNTYGWGQIKYSWFKQYVRK